MSKNNRKGIKSISTLNAPAAVGPYSQAVKSSSLIFCSGQISLVPETGDFAKGDITVQTHQVIKNVMAILEAGGTDISHVVKTTVFLTNMDDFNEMNKVYGEYFHGFLPARSTIQVVALPRGAKIEIEAIAEIP